MRKALTFLLHCAVVLMAHEASAQGCSDAGVCTAGPIGELHEDGDSIAMARTKRHFVRVGLSYAVGEQRTTILIAMTELGFGITDRLGVSVRLPYQSVKGNLGSNSGAGDPIITAAYAFIKQDARGLDAMVGVKLNSGNADALWDGFSIDQVPRSLPMPYQTSLGTTDLLLGLNYRYKRLSGALALQLPVRQANENSFTHASWGEDPAALGYFESAYLERAADAVARIQYRFSWGRFALQPGLLAIQHLGQDSRVDSRTGHITHVALRERVAVQGSEGLTLNITADARCRLSDSWSF